MTSCRSLDPTSYPRLPVQEQLSPVFEYVEIEGKLYIDVENSRCNSRMYQISKEYIGQVGKAIRLDIRECDRIVGYSTGDTGEYASYTMWLESMRQWLLAWL